MIKHVLAEAYVSANCGRSFYEFFVCAFLNVVSLHAFVHIQVYFADKLGSTGFAQFISVSSRGL